MEWTKSNLNSLSDSDLAHLHAAEKALELGDYFQADAEVEKIIPEFRSHPDVMEIRWHICASEFKWGACLDIARAITLQEPKRASGWTHLAHSARQTAGGSVQIAYDILLSALNKVPDEPTIFYDLARYACQLGQLEEAHQWFEKAFQIDSSSKLKKKALNDPDLKMLRRKLRQP